MNERDEKRFKLARLVLLAACVIVLFLLALNGRYQKINEDFTFDKWTGKAKFMLESIK